MPLPQSTRHREKVSALQKVMREFFAIQKKVRIYHGGTNSTRPFTHRKDAVIDISGLDQVLEVNVEERFVLTEPNVTMKALLRSTLPYGLVPKVVMELRSITVGGAIQGGAGESSSFRFGAFHENCSAYEVLLGNGDIITASAEENPEIFRGLPGSYGSLGVITLAKVELVPSKPFVRLAYDKVASFAECSAIMKEKMAGPIDFVDAIMWSKNSGVVMTGYFSEDIPALPHASFLSAWDEWFALHAETVTEKHTHYTELIPTADYLFRYNRGAFWMGKFGFTLLHLPFNRLTRFLLHPLFKTRMLYRLLHATNRSQRYLLQDCVLPENTVGQFFDFVDRELAVYPLWILPLRTPVSTHEMTYGFLDTPLSVDIGIWGEVDLSHAEFVAQNRRIEKVTTELRGCKVLYAHTYYTREEFWQIYRRDKYDDLRKRCHATAVFPDIYDKVSVREALKPSTAWGILKALIPPYRQPLK